MIKEFKTNQKIIANRDCVTAGNFVLSKGTEATIVTHEFPIDKVSVLFEITGKIQGNIMLSRDYVNRNFDDANKNRISHQKMEIKESDISKYPAIAHYRAHGKIFIIKRKLFTNDISNGIDLSYWIYVKNKFLWWNYISSICQGSSRVSKDTIAEAKYFIDNKYPLMSQIEYYSTE